MKPTMAVQLLVDASIVRLQFSFLLTPSLKPSMKPTLAVQLLADASIVACRWAFRRRQHPHVRTQQYIYIAAMDAMACVMGLGPQQHESHKLPRGLTHTHTQN